MSLLLVRLMDHLADLHPNRIVVLIVFELRVVDVSWKPASLFLEKVEGDHLSAVGLDVFILPEPCAFVLCAVEQLSHFVLFSFDLVVNLLVWRHADCFCLLVSEVYHE